MDISTGTLSPQFLGKLNMNIKIEIKRSQSPDLGKCCVNEYLAITVEKNYGERTSLFCVVHSRGGATGHKGARCRAAAMQC